MLRSSSPVKDSALSRLRRGFESRPERLKTIIVYGSKYGATKEIAEKLAEITGYPVKECREVKDISEYERIVIGTGIITGSWARSARRLLKRFRKELKNKEILVFLSAGMTVRDKEKAVKKYCDSVLDKFDLKAECAAFGPVIDLSKNSPYGWLTKKIMKKIAQSYVEAGIEIDFEGKNDLRDWKAIEEFGNKIKN